MTHPRKLIRDAVKLVLMNNTDAQDRVDSSRKNPRSEAASPRGGGNELPAISIYTRDTKTEIFDESPRRYKCVADLTIEGVIDLVPEICDIDDAIDDFETQINNLVLADDSLGGIVSDVEMTGALTVINEVGDKLLGAVIISYAVTYFAHFPIEDAGSLEDLEFIHTEISLSNEQTDIDDRAKSDIDFTEEVP